MFSIAAHALVVVAASRIAWTRLEPVPSPLTEFVWLRVLPPLAEPQVEVVEIPPAASESVAPQPAALQPAITSEPPPAVVAEAPPAPPQPIRSTDWNEERKQAIAAALARQARDNDFSAFAADDRLQALPVAPEAAPARSIFDSQSSGGSSGPSLMQPGQARTRFGRGARELCNALTAGAGISLFGFATLCGSPPDYEPSGLFPEVMPEWLKRMPECAETRPLGPLLAEPSEFPTIKCRMVRKDDAVDALQ